MRNRAGRKAVHIFWPASIGQIVDLQEVGRIGRQHRVDHRIPSQLLSRVPDPATSVLGQLKHGLEPRVDVRGTAACHEPLPLLALETVDVNVCVGTDRSVDDGIEGKRVGAIEVVIRLDLARLGLRPDYERARIRQAKQTAGVEL